MKTLILALARFAVALAVGAVCIQSFAGGAHAAGSQLLRKNDLGLGTSANYLTNDPNAVVNGTHFSPALQFDSIIRAEVHISPSDLDAAYDQKFVAISFDLGLEDRSDNRYATTFMASLDRKLVYQRRMRRGAPITHVVIPFGKAQDVSFTVNEEGNGQHATYTLMGHPTILTALPPSPAAPSATPPSAGGGTVGVQFFAATVAAGGQQVALITAAPGASVVLVIDYPGGSQAVLGPKQAGTDGHLALTWAIPKTVHGKVHVTVDAAGKVAQGSFTVG